MKRTLYAITITFLLAIGLSSCKTIKQAKSISHINGEYIPVATAQETDPNIKQFVEGYKQQLDKLMNGVVGRSDKYMATGAPESYLTNLVTDVMTLLDKKYTDSKTIDLAFMNVHGIRAPFAEGYITLGDVFSTFPFENTLAVLQIKGKYLREIFDAIASKGMVGVSHNAKIEIKNKQVISVFINGQVIDDEKLYTVVTLDYLADGNDGMTAFTKAESTLITTVSLRDYMLEHFAALAKDNKAISSSLDGRIYIVK